MRTAALEAAQGPLRVIYVEADRPADDGAQVRSAACRVCHSDLTMRTAPAPGPHPLVLGVAAMVELTYEGARSNLRFRGEDAA